MSDDLKRTQILQDFEQIMRDYGQELQQGYDIFWDKRPEKYAIRCQSQVSPDNKQQCPNPCVRGSIYCRSHGGDLTKAIVRQTKSDIKKDVGIYSQAKLKVFREELNEIEEFPEEILSDVTNEVKLTSAILIKYMKTHDEEYLMKNMCEFTKLIEKVVEVKEKNYNIKHGSKFSFTLEQVQFLFQRIISATMEIVKNSDELAELAKRYQIIADDISVNGFRVIK
jgi:hypothetical protein